MMAVLLITHAAATWFMTGLIWFVQIVHYPLLKYVPADVFTQYERRHTELTSWVVGPAMLLEGITGAILCGYRPEAVPLWSCLVGCGLLVIIAASTYFIQIPCHDRLCQTFDTNTHRRLVQTNWLRTIAWSLRAIMVSWMCCQ